MLCLVNCLYFCYCWCRAINVNTSIHNQLHVILIETDESCSKCCWMWLISFLNGLLYNTIINKQGIMIISSWGKTTSNWTLKLIHCYRSKSLGLFINFLNKYFLISWCIRMYENQIDLYIHVCDHRIPCFKTIK